MLGIHYPIWSQVCCEANACFEEISDNSGFDTSPYLEELQDSACEVVKILPFEFQRDFKIFDFGFYLHDENFSGGFPDVFEQAKNDAAQRSPYYLLFGKQSDKSGIYTKFWIDIKLPNSGIFSCPPSQEIESLIIQLTTVVHIEYNKNNNNPFSYYLAEIAGMNYLKEFIEKQKICCIPELRDGEFCNVCTKSSD